jgi:hypothetical protein
MSTMASHRHLNDELLVAAANSGDSSAMGALLERHYDRIRAVCCRIAGDTRDGEGRHPRGVDTYRAQPEQF